MIEDRLENPFHMTDGEAAEFLRKANLTIHAARKSGKQTTQLLYIQAMSKAINALEERSKAITSGEKTKCDFCEFLDYLNDPRRDLAPGVYEKLSVALVSEHRNKEDDLFRGRSTHYGYTLNYCPECGRRIKNEI